MKDTPDAATSRPPLHLLVPQGIGDIWWVWQLFANTGADLHIHIAGIDGQDNTAKTVQRAHDWVSGWPGVATVRVCEVSQRDYDALIGRGKYDLAQVLTDAHLGRAGSTEDLPAPFACNRHLENGNRLESLIPQGATLPQGCAYRLPTAPEWHPDLDIASSFTNHLTLATLDPREPVIAWYISGHGVQDGARALGAWDTAQWAALYRAYCAKWPGFEDAMVVLVGAQYDYMVMSSFVREAKVKRSTFFIDQSPSHVLRLLQQADLYVGYQSGLSILADAVDCRRQTMLYFNNLGKMFPTWIKPRAERPPSAEHEPHYACLFDDSPEWVAGFSPWEWPFVR